MELYLSTPSEDIYITTFKEYSQVDNSILLEDSELIDIYTVRNSLARLAYSDNSLTYKSYLLSEEGFKTLIQVDSATMGSYKENPYYLKMRCIIKPN